MSYAPSSSWKHAQNLDFAPSGLWRKAVLGRGGAIPHPGMMTDCIRQHRLLDPVEVDRIVAKAPTSLIAFQEAQARLPVESRRSWVTG